MLLRRPILAASRSGRLRHVIETAPVSRSVVKRFVAGATVEDAVRATRALVEDGLHVSLDHLGEDTTEAAQAASTMKAYLLLLDRLAESDLTPAAEVSVKLSAVGQALDESMALDHAREICDAASHAGTTVTIDMEDHTTTDSTLRIVEALRADFPWTGAVLQSYLHRTEDDCSALATPGSRVRLCKGAYQEPESVAYQSTGEVDRSYIRCMQALFDGAGYPMLATHDPRLIEIGETMAVRSGKRKGDYEFQMLYGIRPDEQRRLAASGEKVRVYLPYGDEWYGYLMRRMAERPANLSFFLRALMSKG
ncbi:MAG: proline dehydrogenase [Frankiales bacterium]|nr:proline dehydrogenase [Frankiales bacterium]